jgi:hypothetical protein
MRPKTSGLKDVLWPDDRSIPLPAHYEFNLPLNVFGVIVCRHSWTEQSVKVFTVKSPDFGSQIPISHCAGCSGCKKATATHGTLFGMQQLRANYRHQGPACLGYLFALDKRGEDSRLLGQCNYVCKLLTVTVLYSLKQMAIESQP